MCLHRREPDRIGQTWARSVCSSQKRHTICGVHLSSWFFLHPAVVTASFPTTVQQVASQIQNVGDGNMELQSLVTFSLWPEEKDLADRCINHCLYKVLIDQEVHFLWVCWIFTSKNTGHRRDADSETHACYFHVLSSVTRTPMTRVLKCELYICKECALRQCDHREALFLSFLLRRLS